MFAPGIVSMISLPFSSNDLMMRGAAASPYAKEYACISGAEAVPSLIFGESSMSLLNAPALKPEPLKGPPPLPQFLELLSLKSPHDSSPKPCDQPRLPHALSAPSVRQHKSSTQLCLLAPVSAQSRSAPVAARPSQARSAPQWRGPCRSVMSGAGEAPCRGVGRRSRGQAARSCRASGAHASPPSP